MTVIRAGSVLLVASFLAVCTPPVAALDPDKRISQFTRTVWEARDGLPMNTVQAVLQTRDGYVPTSTPSSSSPSARPTARPPPVFGGTGLGLAICRTLVEVFGGRTWVESSRAGSTFHFTARFANGSSAAVPAPAAPSARETRAGLRVLLVEDNRINQVLATRLLERRGYEVVLAETGREAVAAHARQKFDVILMDVQMPDMNGFEATTAIRAAEGASGDRTPIVAMTANAMKGDRERCLAEGMDD